MTDVRIACVDDGCLFHLVRFRFSTWFTPHASHTRVRSADEMRPPKNYLYLVSKISVLPKYFSFNVVVIYRPNVNIQIFYH